MLKPFARLAAVVVLFSMLVAGQATRTLAGTTGSIHGTITDTAGHPVAGVQITVAAPSFSNRTTSDANGFYALAGLPPDTYLLTFTREGFQRQQVAGVTLNQDQNYALSIQLRAEVRTIGRVPVRASTSLVQPSTTADTYTVNPTTMQEITGTPQNISETAVLNALPGITTDNAGYPIIRGGAENEEGYELEGIDATEPLSGQFINSLSLAGTARLQLSTGGYDVSEGNTNAGVINEVIKRGSYPGQGEATLRVNSPNYDHRLSFEYGNGSPDNRYSYFFAFNGLRQYRTYGDQKTFFPEAFGATGDATGNIATINTFYRWGANKQNELQYFGESGASVFDRNYQIDPKITPYFSANLVSQLALGPDLIAITPLFPGQVGLNQMTGYPDNETNNHSIQKLNYRRQFNASGFGDVTLFRTDINDLFNLPWNGGFLSDAFQYTQATNYGLSVDYNAQLNSRHQIGIGGQSIYTKGMFALGAPSLAFNTFGNELAYAGTPVLPVLPQNEGIANDPIHRNNIWIKDHWTPNGKLTLTYGLRWDQEVIGLPANVDQVNYSFSTDAAGNVLQVPGPAITNDVVRPSQVSPRLALSYAVNSRDVVRFSYGKNIEFSPLSNIEAKTAADPALANCNISNGCFAPLPGFGTTNNITNLYQSAIGDYNTNFFAQYTPVRPQRATNVDASWEHDFGRGLELRLTPYYRKGVDYVVSNTPVLFTLPDGTPILGSPREQNAGINQNTGVEFQLQKLANVGFSGFLTATYDNTLANYDSDFFPATNNAALAAGHFFHVSYLAPVTATLQLNYNSRNGFHVFANMPYESGYRYGVGKKTFVYAPVGPNGASVPVEVLNTDLAQAELGGSAQSSAYYFTDPNNPGTFLRPNITGSRGTVEGDDPGTIRGPQVMLLNLTVAHDIGRAPNTMQAGIAVGNVLGNYTGGVNTANPRYKNNALGAYRPTSGVSGSFGLQPYRQDYAPDAYLAPPLGAARVFVFYLNTKY
ncbi:MAG: hypothetical protein DLM53_00585 [Candidatus Eremiobacter antarcticus]|nr:MAG: hypothetical protein DLM53_00585 [Candidatus Eremiobacter sp. RRmetagenome_bin22]